MLKINKPWLLRAEFEQLARIENHNDFEQACEALLNDGDYIIEETDNDYVMPTGEALYELLNGEQGLEFVDLYKAYYQHFEEDLVEIASFVQVTRQEFTANQVAVYIEWKNKNE